MNAPTRILIADDHAVVRSGIKFILAMHDNLSLIAEARDGEEAVRLSLELAPDLLLLDLGLPDISGVEAVMRIKQSRPQIKILVFTGSPDPAQVRHALSAGAEGYVLKQGNSDELIVAINALIAGRRYISQGIADQFEPSPSGAPPSRAAPAVPLSLRECDVAKAVAGGLHSTEIAEQLNISPATVKKHRENIRDKLGLRNAAEITAYAIKHGLYAPH